MAMNIVRYILTRLPESLQNRITVWLISSGRIFTTPIWQMLFQTLSFYGGDENKIRDTLVRRHEGVESVISDLCDLGRRTKEEADLRADNDGSTPSTMRSGYLEAAMYYFMGYFFVHDPEASRKIFSQAAPIFDEFRRLHEPPVQKWEFDFRTGGKFFAHVYLPQGRGPFPVIIGYPGNEGIKEHMATYAEYAVRRGTALIAIDPPGFGESGFSGCFLSSVDDYRESTQQLYRRILTEPLLDGNRIATFGVSGGSLSSVIVGGLVDFVTASAGIGAPEYHNLAQVWKNALAEQKRQTYTWTGLTTPEEVVEFLEQYSSDAGRALCQVKGAVLLVHGERDLITKANSGREIAEVIGKNAKYKVIPGDDHLCSNHIGSGLADDIFDWLAAKLECDEGTE